MIRKINSQYNGKTGGSQREIFCGVGREGYVNMLMPGLGTL